MGRRRKSGRKTSPAPHGWSAALTLIIVMLAELHRLINQVS
ncbi:hypothetical protein [Kutzneria sp. 744]|nr:hypothetical protein [Kutzneria sp. 744]